MFGANFPHLQPMAKLRRNQRGEIGRQHVKGALLQPLQSMFWSRSPTQTNDATSQIDHDILYKVSIFPGLFLNSGKI